MTIKCRQIPAIRTPGITLAQDFVAWPDVPRAPHAHPGPRRPRSPLTPSQVLLLIEMVGNLDEKSLDFCAIFTAMSRATFL